MTSGATAPAALAPQSEWPCGRAKRFFDLILVIPLLLLCAMPLVAVTLLVLLLMGRPVFFCQWRGGRGGDDFRVVKFRTMLDHRDADGRLLPDESRTPPLGRFLRRTRLDELPQLWHILRGQMGFVGPRPLLPETVAAWGELGHRRTEMRPGITGWAQVNGNTLLSPDDKLALDLWYRDHASLWLDLAILARTVVTAVKGEHLHAGHLNHAGPYRDLVADMLSVRPKLPPSS